MWLIMIYPIIKYGDPVLRQVGEKIHHITPEIITLAEDLIDTMRSQSGVGLAAHQIGIPLQLAVVDVSSRKKDNGSWVKQSGKAVPWESLMPLVIINPVITATGQPVSMSEGCLSIPNVYHPVSRPASIQLQYMAIQGLEAEIECGGWLARAVQHEADHCFGRLFLDLLSDTDCKHVLEKYALTQNKSYGSVAEKPLPPIARDGTQPLRFETCPLCPCPDACAVNKMCCNKF